VLALEVETQIARIPRCRVVPDKAELGNDRELIMSSLEYVRREIKREATLIGDRLFSSMATVMFPF